MYDPPVSRAEETFTINNPSAEKEQVGTERREEGGAASHRRASLENNGRPLDVGNSLWPDGYQAFTPPLWKQYLVYPPRVRYDRSASNTEGLWPPRVDLSELQHSTREAAVRCSRVVVPSVSPRLETSEPANKIRSSQGVQNKMSINQVLPRIPHDAAERLLRRREEVPLCIGTG